MRPEIANVETTTLYTPEQHMAAAETCEGWGHPTVAQMHRLWADNPSLTGWQAFVAACDALDGDGGVDSSR